MTTKLRPKSQPLIQAEMKHTEMKHCVNQPTRERLVQARGQISNFTTEKGIRTRRLGAILDHMLARGLIDRGLYQAGMTAYNQWYLGGRAPSGLVSILRERVDGSKTGFAPCRLDTGRQFSKAMAALSTAHRRAFETLVLHEINVVVFGRQFYGYKDLASARAVAYAVLKDALCALEQHYCGGNCKVKPSK